MIGFLSEIRFWVERGTRKVKRGNSSVFKNLSHQPFKIENMGFFAGYILAKLLAKNAYEAQSFSREAFSRETVAKVSV